MRSASADRSLVRPAAAALLAVLALLGGPWGAWAADRVRFQGTQALGESALRQAAAAELAALEESGQGADADDAAFQMELTYRKAGHAFAAVEYALAPGPEGLVATFTVAEGPRVQLEGVAFVGIGAYSAQELRSFFPKAGGPYVTSEVQGAVGSVRELYYGSGYLDSQVQPPEVALSADRTRASVTVRLWEGVRHRVGEVRFAGDRLPEAEPLLARARDELLGQPYFGRRKLTLRSRVLEAYGNLGYPEASVEVADEISRDEGRVVLVAAITSGPRVRVGEVVVAGNEKTREEFIRGRLELGPGDLFRLDGQRESFRALYRTGLFSKVELGLEPGGEGETRVLRVAVEEAPSREVYVEPGWGSYEQLRLRAGLREQNLLGTGRVVGLEGSASVKARGLSAGLTDPWFLGSEVTADLPLSYQRREEPSFTREDVGGSLLFSRQLGRDVTVTAGYGYRATALTEVAVDAAAEDLDTGYNLASVKVQATYDTRDDLFLPTRGQRVFLAAEHADPWLGGDVAFDRFTGGARQFVPLGSRTVLGLRWATGLILPGRGEVTVPLGERYFNGGENTVRSFREAQLGPADPSGEPAGGLAYNVVSVELRRRLIGNLAGSVFADLGNVAPNRTRTERGEAAYESRSQIVSDTFRDYFSDFRPGVGCGLQYLLPVGPARLDLAVNPDAREDRGEVRFAWHFSVGMAF